MSKSYLQQQWGCWCSCLFCYLWRCCLWPSPTETRQQVSCVDCSLNKTSSCSDYSPPSEIWDGHNSRTSYLCCVLLSQNPNAWSASSTRRITHMYIRRRSKYKEDLHFDAFLNLVNIWWRILTFRSPFGRNWQTSPLWKVQEGLFSRSLQGPWLQKPVHLGPSSWYHHKNHIPKHTWASRRR